MHDKIIKPFFFAEKSFTAQICLEVFSQNIWDHSYKSIIHHLFFSRMVHHLIAAWKASNYEQNVSRLLDWT